MTREAGLRADLVEAGRLLAQLGFLPATDGNLSVRLETGRLLVTPAGVRKGALHPDALCVVDLDGRLLTDSAPPSSELRMHLEVYRRRPDVHAVVHAHPPTATGFAVAGVAIDQAELAETVVTLGPVPVVPYGTPSTEAVADQLRPFLQAHDGLLLANHGALTLGPTLWRAVQRMEALEHAARVSLVARQLGGARRLDAAEVARLEQRRPPRGPGTAQEFS